MIVVPQAPVAKAVHQADLWPVFLKAVYKNIKSTGKQVTNYRLVESYRFAGTVRHQTILHIGTLSELPDVEQKRALSIRINELVKESHSIIS